MEDDYDATRAQNGHATPAHRDRGPRGSQDHGDVSGRDNGYHPPLYRMSSNQSSNSIFEDVEMAHNELYAGPIAESLPTSVSAFSHRRHRADSTTSFVYHEEEPEGAADDDADETLARERASIDYTRRGSDIGDLEFGDFEDEDSSADREYDASADDFVLHRRRSSSHSQTSARARLLRHDSTTTDHSLRGRTSQRVYMANEDLNIAIAGFRTSRPGYLVYLLLCFVTGGLAYLAFRWMPRWQVAILGQPRPLREADWVVVENQWAELSIINVRSRPYGKPVSTVFGLPEKMDVEGLDDENDPLIPEVQILDYRYVRFCFHPLRDKFMMTSGWKDPEWTDTRLVRAGLDSDEKMLRDTIFGSNEIDIEEKTLGKLLVDEALHPFYIFQVACFALWSLESYYSYAICILIVSLASIATTVFETRSTMRRLREISRFECDVRVLRSGFWRYVSSVDLVPGDIYELSDPNLSQFPSDSLLLSGDCIVNESMLTGESVPVTKVPASDEALQNMDLHASSVSAETARHFLFCGTKIVRTRRPQEEEDGDAAALALVVRTGFNTTKGALIRSMLFPRPAGLKFYRDSFRYIGVMSIVAGLGFIASCVNFVELGLHWTTILVRALDLITIVVPPALPATLTIGTNFALSRLRKKEVFCISPQRVNVGGKVDIMCFDKTGTLTEDGLDVLGLRVTSRGAKRFSELVNEPPTTTEQPLTPENTLQSALYTMATCHSLRSVDGELIGDPLDVKMFEFTGWTFEEGKQLSGDAEDEEQGGLAPSVARPPGGNLELGVLKTFEFVSNLRRASVVVREFGQKSANVFVKGAPEAMREICRPESFPEDYDELLSHYTHQGYRVIACASRHVKRLTWVKAQKMTRADVESNLDFLGFIIFENKLKPASAGVLQELHAANIATVMVTGDNILTAISVARESSLISRNAHCFVPRFIEGDMTDPKAKLQWESILHSKYCLDSETLLTQSAPPEEDSSLPYDISNLRDYSLAVSGDVFRWIVDYGSPQVLKRMLVKGKVFARMSPDEKHELIEKLQSIDYSCGFCGDGANDCGALSAADVGISLSEAEASVAAPFTSRVFDIRCVLEVIREGRAALVTSFSCFKYMSIYSAIQFTSVSFLYAKASNLGDFQFLFIDLFLLPPIAILMGWAGPSTTLSRKRPVTDLVSRKILVPLLGLMCICIAGQAIAWVTVREQPWYIPPIVESDGSDVANSENTALFLTSCFQYIFAGVVLNAGRPFRQSITRNWPFMVTVALTFFAAAYMLFGPARWLYSLMELTKTSLDYQFFVVLLSFVFLAVAWTFDRYVAARIAKGLGMLKKKVTGREKARKEYKVIDEGMLDHQT